MVWTRTLPFFSNILRKSFNGFDACSGVVFTPFAPDSTNPGRAAGNPGRGGGGLAAGAGHLPAGLDCLVNESLSLSGDALVVPCLPHRGAHVSPIFTIFLLLRLYNVSIYLFSEVTW